MFGTVPSVVHFAYAVLRDCYQFFWPSVTEAEPAVCQCQCEASACPAAAACPGCPPAASCPAGVAGAVPSWATVYTLGLGVLLIVFLLGYTWGHSTRRVGRLPTDIAHRTRARRVAGDPPRKSNGGA